MTLGANIGTTFTSMLAALAIMKPDAIQIAFCVSTVINNNRNNSNNGNDSNITSGNSSNNSDNGLVSN